MMSGGGVGLHPPGVVSDGDGSIRVVPVALDPIQAL